MDGRATCNKPVNPQMDGNGEPARAMTFGLPRVCFFLVQGVTASALASGCAFFFFHRCTPAAARPWFLFRDERARERERKG